MRRLNQSVASISVVLFFCGCQLVPDLVLRPSADIKRNPAEFGYSYEEIVLDVAEGKQISIWRVPTSSDVKKGTLVIVPGNDSNKGRYSLALPLFVDTGWDVILMDYEGFGASTGQASFGGLIESTAKVIEYAKGQDQVVVGLGISLGAPVLIRVAADHDLSAVILDGTVNVWQIVSQWTDDHGLGNPIWGVADAIAALSTSEDFDSARWITQVAEPKLFLHSPDDNVAPFDGAMALFQAAPQPKHFFVTQGEHALQQFFDPTLYREVVNGWLDGIVLHDSNLTDQYLNYLDEEVQQSLEELGFVEQASSSGG